MGLSLKKSKNNETPPKTEEEITLAENQINEQSKKIDFYITEFSVEHLAGKMNSNEYVIPEYQREYTWEDDRKSRFIESLIIGLPIPFLFFWERKDGKFEIVDGSQRLRAIEEFILGEFRLGNLENLSDLSGFRFIDLLESRQRKVKNRSIRGIILNEHADEQARFDLFDRINTGSKIANKAEVRRGALRGPFMDFIIELSKEEIFVEIAPVTQKQKAEREREELISRFFAYGDGLDVYQDRSSEFIFNYIKMINKIVTGDPLILERYKSVFQRTMKFISERFPYGFRKSIKGKVSPRARFEAIAIGSRKALEEKPDLPNEGSLDITSWLNSQEFGKVTGSDGANARAKLEERIGFVHNRLLGR